MGDWSQLTFCSRTLNVIFYSHIKEPSGLMCLKSLCGIFMLFYLKKLVWGLVANGRKFMICLQMWGAALQGECRISWPCAACFLSTVGLVVGVVLLVPCVVTTSISMCRVVLEKIIVCWRDLFLGHIYLHYAKMSVGWKSGRNGCPKGNRSPDVNVMCIFWKGDSRLKCHFLG